METTCTVQTATHGKCGKSAWYTEKSRINEKLTLAECYEHAMQPGSLYLTRQKVSEPASLVRQAQQQPERVVAFRPLKPSDLTRAQRSNLVRFVSSYRAITNTSRQDGIRDKDFGSKSGLDHLIRKGALKVLREEVGQRGGKTRILVPTPEGLKLADHITFNNLKTY